jgi:hypothetical protein
MECKRKKKVEFIYLDAKAWHAVTAEDAVKWSLSEDLESYLGDL